MDSLDEYIFAAAGGIAAIRILWMRRQRLASFKAYAHKNGYTFHEEPEGLIGPLEGLELFSAQQNQMIGHQEETRYIDFALEKRIENFTIQIMQYSRMYSSFSQQQNRSTMRARIHMVCAVHSEGKDYPHFSLREPSAFIDQGHSLIHFNEAPDFSQQFALCVHQEEEKSSVQQLFHADPRKFLMEMPKFSLPLLSSFTPSVQMEGRGKVLVAYCVKMMYLKPSVRLMKQTLELARKLQ